MTLLPKKLLNFTKALAKHASNGFQHVSEEVYGSRTSICEECPLLKNKECGLCGCPVEKKALWASESCPDGRWKSQKKKPTNGFSANSGSVGEDPKTRKCSSCKNRH